MIPSWRAISVEFLPTENNCKISRSWSESGETGAGRPATSGTLANCREICVILRRSSSFFFCSVMSCASCTIKRLRLRASSCTRMGHAHPHSTPGAGFHFQIKVWDVEVPFGTVPDAAIITTDVGA